MCSIFNSSHRPALLNTHIKHSLRKVFAVLSVSAPNIEDQLSTAKLLLHEVLHLGNDFIVKIKAKPIVCLEHILALNLLRGKS
jgi:hypothetical protein